MHTGQWALFPCPCCLKTLIYDPTPSTRARAPAHTRSFLHLLTCWMFLIAFPSNLPGLGPSPSEMSVCSRLLTKPNRLMIHSRVHRVNAFAIQPLGTLIILSVWRPTVHKTWSHTSFLSIPKAAREAGVGIFADKELRWFAYKEIAGKYQKGGI